MSVFAEVYKKMHESDLTLDDTDTLTPIVEALPPEEKAIFREELEIFVELLLDDPRRPDSYILDQLEKMIVDLGIESEA